VDSEKRIPKNWVKEQGLQWLIVLIAVLWTIAAVVLYFHQQREQEAEAAAARAAAEEATRKEAEAKAAKAVKAAAEKQQKRAAENLVLEASTKMFDLIERDIKPTPAGNNILEVYAYDGELTEKMMRDLCVIRSRAMQSHGVAFFQLVVFRKPGNYAKSKTSVPAAYALPEQEFLRSFMRIHYSSRIDYKKGDVSWSTKSLRAEDNRLEIVFDE
jgi:hypothetical protein